MSRATSLYAYLADRVNRFVDGDEPAGTMSDLNNEINSAIDSGDLDVAEVEHVLYLWRSGLGLG